MASKPKGREVREVQVAVGVHEIGPRDIRADLAIGRERVDFTPDEARRIAASLVRAAEIAESEMFLYRFAQQIGADLDDAEAMIGEFRRQRMEQLGGPKVESA
jgi:hypothetical protein